ncbi:MAG: hypothetical protein HY235_24080 [Acidobacteria bacterium]|nr:hypothetical protein [Acidobacteriota bacterium]
MLVAVGGHSRNIGKTSVVCGLIAAIPEARWLAVKITQHGHEHCTTDGAPCDCDPGDPLHPYALDEQIAPDETDSGRYLKAGAAQSYWLRTATGSLGHALPALNQLLTEHRNVIVESNSLMRFFEPEVYLMVLDYTVADMKDSAWSYMDRADAFVLIQRDVAAPWQMPERWFRHKPVFAARPPEFVGVELAAFIRQRLPEVSPCASGS